VDIFNCPTPSLDSRGCVKKINEFFVQRRKIDFSHIKIDSYIQTEDDIRFCNEFYELMDKFFSLSNNYNTYIIINSWASFKNLEGYNQYKMFEKILDLANKNNIMATEWTFKDDLCISTIISRFFCDIIRIQDKSIQDKSIQDKSIQSNNYNENNELVESNIKFIKKSCLYKNILYTRDNSYNRQCIYYDSRVYNIYFDGGICICEV
jgi:hypothetical protein